ncbi:ABC transporter permease [Labrys neptuniae]|uniref:ABC transporter permease n=1 Tax=Labrys neptuniae TaxID=376174 RepID=UPI0028921116|nr:ABC transporter permease [Labrys neptuniae]MDT3378551.1 ABC transporter permease [Labrys neptuniae]
MATRSAAPETMPLLKRWRLEQEAITLGVVAALVLLLAFGAPAFLNANNLDSLQTSLAPNMIIAIGMMVLFITGLFDLSVGAVMGLSGIVTAYALSAGFGMAGAIVCGLAVGAVIGLANGVLVAVFRINHLIATLGMMYMVRGLVEVMLIGTGLGGFTEFPAAFTLLGNGQVFGIYGMFIFALGLVIAGEFILRRTILGRRLYFLGGNPEAAGMIGINATRLRIGVFVFSGLMASLAGVLVTARIGMANRYLGVGLEMNIIIACLVGGGSIAGGKGSLIGAMLGVGFISLMTNAFNLFEVPSEWQSSVIGLVLVIVVVIDAIMLLRKQRLSWATIFGTRSLKAGR